MAKGDNKKQDEGQSAEQMPTQTVEERKQELDTPTGISASLDGAAREALAIQKGHNRAAGADINEDYLALTHEDALDKGYLGYSPVGPGENDGTGTHSRLGTQGDFGEE